MSKLSQFGFGGGVGSFPGVYASDPVVGSAPDGILIVSGATDGYVPYLGDSTVYSTLEMVGVGINDDYESEGRPWFSNGPYSTVTTLKNVTINSTSSLNGVVTWSSLNNNGSAALTTIDNLNVYMYINKGFAGLQNVRFYITGYPNLVNVTAGAIRVVSSTGFVTRVNLDFTNNALSQASVDSILTSVVPAVGGDGGGTLTLKLQGGTNSAPGAAGLAAKATLVAAGWTVTHN